MRKERQILRFVSQKLRKRVANGNLNYAINNSSADGRGPGSGNSKQIFG